MRRALVVVDMQNGFINDNTRGLVDKQVNFIRNNREKFQSIIYTKYINHTETACYKFEGWKDCMKGTSDTDIVDGLVPYIGEIVEKDKYSCWNEEFISKLRNKKIDKVYFMGVNTGCCVLHSAFDAYNNLQDCAVISDLCGSTSGESSHNAAIQILQECITKDRVITSEELEIVLSD